MKHYMRREKLLAKLEDTCLKCAYWTKNKKDSEYKCYTPGCPAYQRDNKPKGK